MIYRCTCCQLIFVVPCQDQQQNESCSSICAECLRCFPLTISQHERCLGCFKNVGQTLRFYKMQYEEFWLKQQEEKALKDQQWQQQLQQLQKKQQKQIQQLQYQQQQQTLQLQKMHYQRQQQLPFQSFQTSQGYQPNQQSYQPRYNQPSFQQSYQQQSRQQQQSHQQLQQSIWQQSPSFEPRPPRPRLTYQEFYADKHRMCSLMCCRHKSKYVNSKGCGKGPSGSCKVICIAINSHNCPVFADKMTWESSSQSSIFVQGGGSRMFGIQQDFE